jgi:multicomponent Na+:H+ antiporter subunit B
MKLLTGIVCGFVGLLLLYGVSDPDDFPAWGDPNSPASTSPISEYFIQNTMKDSEVPNMVTSVLADYRGWDTMFETVVVFVAGIAIFAVIRSFDVDVGAVKKPKVREADLVLKHTVRLLIPVIQIFSLYVLGHGHGSPGGGFQGGVILGASFILVALVWDIETALKRFSEKQAIFCAGIGIFIYAGFGFLSLFFGAEFLNYGVLEPILPGIHSSAKARYIGMLIVEIGVMCTVASVLYLIYALLATRGRMQGGL